MQKLLKIYLQLLLSHSCLFLPHIFEEKLLKEYKYCRQQQSIKEIFLMKHQGRVPQK